MSDIHKLSGAYALDALDDLERARFEDHLATCDDCAAEVAELQETAALLAETSAAPAPASLREGVLAGISQVRPLPPAVSPRRAVSRWFPLLVAAALVLVTGVGLTVWQPWASDEAPRLTAAERVLQAPDAEEVAVDLGEAGRAKVVRSVSEDRAVLVTDDMVSAPEGKVYEVWLQSPEGEMLPAGLMPDDPDQTIVLDGEAGEATAVGITVEPDGGSPEPSGEPIVLFDLSQAT